MVLGKDRDKIVRDTTLKSEVLCELFKVVQLDVLLVASVRSFGLLRCAQSQLFGISELLESISSTAKVVLGGVPGLLGWLGS